MRAIFFEPDEAWRLLAVAEASDAELCAFPTLVLYRGFDCPKPGLKCSAVALQEARAIVGKTKNGDLGPCCTSPMECLLSRSEPVLQSDRHGAKRACAIRVTKFMERRTEGRGSRVGARRRDAALATSGGHFSKRSRHRCPLFQILTSSPSWPQRV
jgi:hypothetical protein